MAYNSFISLCSQKEVLAYKKSELFLCILGQLCARLLCIYAQMGNPLDIVVLLPLYTFLRLAILTSIRHFLVFKNFCLERLDKDNENIDMYLHSFLIFFQSMQQQ